MHSFCSPNFICSFQNFIFASKFLKEPDSANVKYYKIYENIINILLTVQNHILV